MPIVSLFATACSTQPDTAPMPPFQTTANMTELMEHIVDPAADVIWDSVGTIITMERRFEKAPSTDDEWLAVRSSALVLAESGNLLMLPSRSGGNAEWLRLSSALVDQSNRAIKAIDSQDADELFAVGGAIYEVCLNCHNRFNDALAQVK